MLEVIFTAGIGIGIAIIQRSSNNSLKRVNEELGNENQKLLEENRLSYISLENKDRKIDNLYSKISSLKCELDNLKKPVFETTTVSATKEKLDGLFSYPEKKLVNKEEKQKYQQRNSVQGYVEPTYSNDIISDIPVMIATAMVIDEVIHQDNFTPGGGIFDGGGASDSYSSPEPEVERSSSSSSSSYSSSDSSSSYSSSDSSSSCSSSD